MALSPMGGAGVERVAVEARLRIDSESIRHLQLRVILRAVWFEVIKKSSDTWKLPQ